MATPSETVIASTHFVCLVTMMNTTAPAANSAHAHRMRPVPTIGNCCRKWSRSGSDRPRNTRTTITTRNGSEAPRPS